MFTTQSRIRMMFIVGLVLIFFPASGGTTAKETTANDANVTTANNLPADPQERLKWAEKQSGELDVLRKKIQRALAAARSDHDIVKVTCLNDKLTQTNANIASFADRVKSFRKAAAIGDRVQQDHEFTLLTVLVQKGQTLAAEAGSCVGEEAGYTGKTSISTEVDDNITQEDPTRDSIPGVDVSVDVRPPDASGQS